jgi:pilus assembly protein CpaC
MSGGLRRLVLTGLLFCWVSPNLGAQLNPSAPSRNEPNRVLLTPGELSTIPLESDIERLAVGDPNVCDVNILSPRELLIQARSIGLTNLIVWYTNKSKVELVISVVDPRPLTASRELERILARSERYKEVAIELEKDKVFLVGEVKDEDTFTSLMELVAAYPDVVVNLVTIKPEEEYEIPQAMIQLQVQLIEVSKRDLKEVGFTWNQDFVVAESTSGASTGALSASEAFGRWGEKVARSQLGTVLDLLISENKARLLSEPKLVTTSGKEASTHLGLDIPVLTKIDEDDDNNRIRYSYEYRQVGVKLTITPRAIHTEGMDKINVVIESEVSAVDDSQGISVTTIGGLLTIPAFKVRSTTTEVTASPGETFAIAGLLTNEESDTMTRVPGLSRIPWLGKLFQSPSKELREEELLITLTPDFVESRDTSSAGLDVAFDQAVDQAREVQSGEWTQDPVLQYVREVQQKVAGSLEYPRDIDSTEAVTVRLRLRILQDGSLDRVVVSESSGVGSFDLQAVKAASSIGTYPPLPAGLNSPELWVDVPVIFQP